MNRKLRHVYAAPYSIWAAGFIIIPLLVILYYAFTADAGGFTLSNILEVTRAENLKALGLSILLSLISTLTCLLLAYPLAMILSRMQLSAGFMIFLFILPMWMNSLLRIFAWQALLEKHGVINWLLGIIGVAPLNIINTPTAIIIGMVYDYIPFMILPIYNSLCKIDPNVLNAARDLGATEWQTVTKVMIPLSLPGIISGITMVFVPSLTTFAISAILGGSKILLIGNVIEQQFTALNNRHIGSGLSFVLMIFVFISMAMVSKYDKEGGSLL
ncbi:MAG: ABC transporter permease [Lachnospiraceae bacterium]|nr:ABC transporter permease [Lachnospiraceae bacterium]